MRYKVINVNDFVFDKLLGNRYIVMNVRHRAVTLAPLDYINGLGKSKVVQRDILKRDYSDTLEAKFQPGDVITDIHDREWKMQVKKVVLNDNRTDGFYILEDHTCRGFYTGFSLKDGRPVLPITEGHAWFQVV